MDIIRPLKDLALSITYPVAETPIITRDQASLLSQLWINNYLVIISCFVNGHLKNTSGGSCRHQNHTLNMTRLGEHVHWLHLSKLIAALSQDG